MLDFIAGNYPTVIVGLIVLAAVTAIIIKIIKDKKNHKCSCGGCGGNCACCPNAAKDSDAPQIVIKKAQQH